MCWYTFAHLTPAPNSQFKTRIVWYDAFNLLKDGFSGAAKWHEQYSSRLRGITIAASWPSTTKQVNSAREKHSNAPIHLDTTTVIHPPFYIHSAVQPPIWKQASGGRASGWAEQPNTEVQGGLSCLSVGCAITLRWWTPKHIQVLYFYWRAVGNLWQAGHDWLIVAQQLALWQ